MRTHKRAGLLWTNLRKVIVCPDIADFISEIDLISPDGYIPDEIPDLQSPEVAEFISVIVDILARLQQQNIAMHRPVEGNYPGSISLN